MQLTYPNILLKWDNYHKSHTLGDYSLCGEDSPGWLTSFSKAKSDAAEVVSE
ncbi:hypothetical protein EYZ11_006313 [Aspergillus tanneri]|uniref:Uncharacterized protein n=1 Tax=Aspergillus tanneri TaxID=1220188 RepID=A0A4V3UP92_9EURO|nr:hypothetical protein EYZ11_006313 [Aspergillus tanneri]